MAEEEAAAAPAAAAPEAEAAKDAKENGAAGAAEPKDEEVKKCDKPNKEEFDAKVQKLNDEIAELNNKLSAIDVNIAKTKSANGGGTDDFSQAKAQMKTLRDQKARVGPLRTRAAPRDSRAFLRSAIARDGARISLAHAHAYTRVHLLACALPFACLATVRRPVARICPPPRLARSCCRAGQGHARAPGDRGQAQRGEGVA